MQALIAIFLLILLVFLVIGGLMAAAHFISRSFGAVSPSTPDKERAYECGVIGEPAKTNRMSSGFYLTAILFVLFDIEIIFLYPWAVAYRDFLNGSASLQYFLAFLIFLGLFILGLFWEIRVQALKWK